jgi:translation initiation factor RLI1
MTCSEILRVCYTGKLCIEVGPASKVSFISEELCIGCGICVKVYVLITKVPGLTLCMRSNV